MHYGLCSYSLGLCKPIELVPQRLRQDMAHFTWDTPVVKVNYALDAPVPWRSPSLRGAGTVHLGADHHGLIRWFADLNTATVPEQPFILFGQMTPMTPVVRQQAPKAPGPIRICLAAPTTSSPPIGWRPPSIGYSRNTLRGSAAR